MALADRYVDPAAVTSLVDALLAGDRRALARALRLVDDAPVVGREIVSRLHAHQRGAQVVGVTGNPGAGKSTIVDCMLEHLRTAGKRVGVLAVDPSSPFTGGAILGDRIRMSRHYEDDGVFIRSFATRGTLGGLSRSTFDAVCVLDAAGFDVILLETVGVGQDEIDVVRYADTTIVVLVPGMGDDIQAIKAGLLEIADIFLVNKADRDGAAEVERALQQMLSLATRPASWEPPIKRSIASRGEGIVELLAEVERHRAWVAGPEGRQRRKQRRRELFERLFDSIVVERARERLREDLMAAAQRVVDTDADPYVVVKTLLESLR